MNQYLLIFSAASNLVVIYLNIRLLIVLKKLKKELTNQHATNVRLNNILSQFLKF